MVDRSELADAYEQWSQLIEMHKGQQADLREFQAQADKRATELEPQLQEAQKLGDADAIQRIEDALAEARDAWTMATHALGETDKQDQPQDPKEDDDGSTEGAVEGGRSDGQADSAGGSPEPGRQGAGDASGAEGGSSDEPAQAGEDGPDAGDGPGGDRDKE